MLNTPTPEATTPIPTVAEEERNFLLLANINNDLPEKDRPLLKQVELQINGKPVVATMDTAAEITVMDADTALHLGLKVTDAYTGPPIRSAQGLSMETMGTLTTPILEPPIIVKFVVIQNLQLSILLGGDFLNRFDTYKVDHKKSMLHLDGYSLPLLKPSKLETKDKIRVLLEEDYIVKPFTEMIIFAKPDLPIEKLPKIGIIEPAMKDPRRYPYVANSVVTPANRVPIRLCNPTANVMSLRVNTCIATLEPLEERYVNSMELLPEMKDGEEWTVDELFSRIKIASKSLSPDQRKKIQLMLWRLRRAFAKNDNSIKQTDLAEHSINTGDAAPLRSRPYRLSHKEYEVVKEEIDKMLKNNVIRKSNSPWASPVVLVQKKDGSIRFCVDYRRLNSVTKKDVYPIPRVDESLERFKDMKWFSVLDLKSGYWQIKIKEEDKQKTAFVTRDGLYEFNVVPFGLCNAPATFQRTMDLALAGLKWTVCLVYMDDIIIFSKTFEEHLEAVATVLVTLIKHNLMVKPEKLQLFMDKVNYLGHVISENGVEPDPAKVRAVSKFEPPKTVTEVKQFLGLCSYYRKFIHNFASISLPLVDLTRKESKWEWNDKCQEAFQTLKQKLVTAPILAFPDFDEHFFVTTDASDRGIGAILSQEKDGKRVVIAYASRVLSSAEQNYFTTEKECLAVVWALEQFRPYIFGLPITIETDHKCLTWVKNFKKPTSRLFRWIATIDQYDYQVVYKEGKSIPHVDALSRYGYSDSVSINAFLKNRKRTLPDLEAFRDDQVKDDTLAEFWEEAEEAKGTNDLGPQFIKENELLYRVKKIKQNGIVSFQSKQLVVPTNRRYEILYYFHESKWSGHLGVTKTLQRLKERYYWPGMKGQVAAWIASCRICASRKDPKMKRVGKLHPIPVPPSAFSTIGIDIVGPLTTSRKGNKYILVITDYLTRWPEAFAIPNQQADTIAKILVEEIICRYSVPRRIISDRGKAFLGDLMSAIYDLLDIHKVNTTAYHPQTDGLTERFNKTLGAMLNSYVDKHQDTWDDYIPFVLFAYRTSIQESTKEKPFKLVYGFEPRLPMDILLTAEEEIDLPIDSHKRELAYKIEDARNLARENLQAAQSKYTRNHDNKFIHKEYSVNELVWIYKPVVKKGQIKKFKKQWKGPYKIIEKLTNDNYKVTRGKQPEIVHVSNMKKATIISLPKSNANTTTKKTTQEEDRQIVSIKDHRLSREPDGFFQEYLVKRKGDKSKDYKWTRGDLIDRDLLIDYMLDNELDPETLEILTPAVIEDNHSLEEEAVTTLKKSRTKRPPELPKYNLRRK